MLVFLNDKFLSTESAGIPVDNRSFRYGDGFFETMRANELCIPLWDLHMQRLMRTLAAMGFEKPALFTPDWLADKVAGLLKKNNHTQIARIRLTIFRGSGGLFDTISQKPQVLIQSWPIDYAHQALNENGLVTGFYPGGFKAADDLANHKTNSYLLYVLAAQYAKAQRWNDAIVLNHRQTVCDATIANVWIGKDNHITTPPLTDGPVAGVMRTHLLSVLPTLGFSVSEAPVGPDTMRHAETIFFTNAIYGIKWVGRLGESMYGKELAQIIHHQIVAPLWRATN